MNHLPSRTRLRWAILTACSAGDLIELHSSRITMLRRGFFAKVWMELTLDVDMQRVPQKMFKVNLTCEHVSLTNCMCTIRHYDSHSYTEEELNIEQDFEF